MTRTILTSSRWPLVAILMSFVGLPILTYYAGTPLLCPAFDLADSEDRFPILVAHRNAPSGRWVATAMSYSQVQAFTKGVTDYSFAIPDGLDTSRIEIVQPDQKPQDSVRNRFRLHRAQVKMRELEGGWQRLQVTVWGDSTVKIVSVSEARGRELKPLYYRYIIRVFKAALAVQLAWLINVPLWGGTALVRWLCRRGRTL
ncbi:MAG: hypothetical protein KBC96_04675 [Armatimonadetes bacterium]|nr:hypothetical protein [Armatimonadota bacterium]